jgi:hypothetical protein
MALVRSASREPMHQNNRIIVFPKLSGYVSIFSVHHLINFDFIVKKDYFCEQVSHKNNQNDMPILVGYLF